MSVSYDSQADETTVTVSGPGVPMQTTGELGDLVTPDKETEDFDAWWSESEANNGVLVQELAEHFD